MRSIDRPLKAGGRGAGFARFGARLLACVLACAVVSVGAANPAFAQASGALAQLKRFVAETRSARGEFTQRSQRGRSEAADTSSGRFAFVRPGLFRWEVSKPFEQLMVADGERLYFLDRDLNQVTVRKLADSLGASPAAILFGSDDLERNFTLRDAGERDALAWLEALPRVADAGFERILIGFRDNVPEAMEVKDAFGRTTRFSFRAIERNPSIDPAQFRFVAPAGADVIRQ
ncbi:MAG: outer membrane lipoprotein chaperone LolA [Burkholderiaceae bacterium]|nr:outer membrane lipoprotein chaperone LolA [Burkholderiaceae bacterium]